MRKQTAIILLAGSLGVSLLLHGNVLGRELTGYHVWRQSITMWQVRNFMRYDANILNPRIAPLGLESGAPLISRYEFPLLQWSLAAVQRVTGENITVVRLILFALGSLATLGFFYWLLALGFEPRTALIGAVFWQCSPLFFYYTVNPMPDLLGGAAGVGYLAFITAYRRSRARKNLRWAALALSVATLAKLPFLMFSVVSIGLFFNRKTRRIPFVATHLVALLPALIWYAWVMPGWSGNGIMRGIFDGTMGWTEASRLSWFHLTEMFPAILLGWGAVPLFLLGITRVRKRRWIVLPLASISLLFLVLELNMVGQNHDYYLWPLLPWLFVCVASGIEAIQNAEPRWLSFLLFPLLGLAIYWAFNFAQPRWSAEQAYFNQDVFNYREQLQSAAPDSARVLIVNDGSHNVFAYQIDKQGLSFEQDGLYAHDMSTFVDSFGATYLYSDSRKVEGQAGLRPYLDSLVLEAGSVRVFKLRSAALQADTVPPSVPLRHSPPDAE